MTPNNHDLLVIGAGHMRTGTTSLKLALELLFGQKCYHMNEIKKYNHDHVKIWIDILNGKKLNRKMCDILFQGYCSAVDYPSSLFYMDLMEIYPSAKVILTTRDSDSWLQSSKNTTMKTIGSSIFQYLYLYYNGLCVSKEFKQKLLSKVFRMTVKDELPSDEHMKQCFEDFNEEVRKTVPKERLLEFNIKDGWGPLCKFLDLPKPNEPFPFVNTTEEIEKKTNKMIYISTVKCGTLLSMLLLSAVVLVKMYARR